MASYEPSRVSAYSEDLRWRMVWQVEELRYPHEQVPWCGQIHCLTHHPAVSYLRLCQQEAVPKGEGL